MVDKMAFSKLNDRSEKNNNQNDILTFIKQNIRYFTAGALFVALVLVLVNCGAPKTTDNKDLSVMATEAETETEEAYQIDAYENVNALINQYFTAYAAGDVDTIAAIATPLSDNEKSYIAEYSKYVESYENIKCYTKHGLDENSYIASVYIEIKFTDAQTVAPGLEFFYIRTNEDGSLYIDNLYSNYNLKIKENASDTSVQSLIAEYEKSADFVALQQEVQTKFNDALAADTDLADVINIKLPAAITTWKQELLAQQSSETTEETEQVEETQQPETEVEEAEETDASKDDENQPEETTEQVYTVDKVNVRAAADTSSEKLGSVDKGTAIGRTGTDGDWSIVNYGGVTGYIKTEYLSTEKPNEENNDTNENEGNTTAVAIEEGKVITLSDSVNIRDDMSETAKKIGTAYSGEKVTVIMSYAEGWTKVTWKDKTGYIKTSLLQ